MRGIILLILLLVNSYSLGQDLVVEYGKPLLIKEDTTWSGEILIQDFVDVAPGSTLTIAPGTTVTFEELDGESAIRVFGNLVAVRSESNEPIVFINGNIRGSYVDADSNGHQRDINKTDPYPHPQITFDGVEYYGNQFNTQLQLEGISRAQNSFFYGVRIYLFTAISLENNTLVNSSIGITSFPVEGDLYRGHYYDVLNNDISWDKFYVSNLSPVEITDAYTLRFEGNNLGGVYLDREPFAFSIYYPGSTLDLNSNYINFDNYPNPQDFFFDESDSVNGGEIIRDDLLSGPNLEAGWGQTPSLDVSEFRDGDTNPPVPVPDPDPTPDPIPLPIPDPQDETNEVNIVVAPYVIGNSPVYVAGLTERKRYSGSLLVSHTLEYAGVVYNYDDVDQYLTIVERGGAFTDNFRSEMLYVVSLLNPAELKGVLGSSYSDAIIFIVGFDGDFAN
jgi:hypothetical protein